MKIIALTHGVGIGSQVDYIRPCLTLSRTGIIVSRVVELLSRLLPSCEKNKQTVPPDRILNHPREPKLPSRRGINRPLNPSRTTPPIQVKRLTKLRVAILILLNRNHRIIQRINMKHKSLRTAKPPGNALNLRGQINRKRISRPICLLPIRIIKPNVTNLDIVPATRIPHRYREMKIVIRVHSDSRRSNLIQRCTTLGHLNRSSPSRAIIIDIVKLVMVTLVVVVDIKSNVNIITTIYTSTRAPTRPMLTSYIS